MIHSESEPARSEHAFNKMQKESHVRYESQIKRANGTCAEVEISSRVTDAGKGVIRNISAHKQTKEAIKESDERYRLLFENIPSVTWVIREDGKTSFISPNIERIYGFSNKEIYKGGDALWFERIHSDDAGLVKESFEMLFTKEHEFDIEYRIKGKTGSGFGFTIRPLLPSKK